MGLKDTLKKLFTRNVVVTHERGVLKVFDVNKTQSVGGQLAKPNRYTWQRGSNMRGDGYSYNSAQFDIEASRLRMYGDYETMDADAIIASALDIYADSATVKDANGQLLTIHTTDASLKKILYNLFYDILNIEFNLWAWCRELCKFGDYFLYLTIKEKFGVVNVIPIHPSMINREEANVVGFEGQFKYKYVGSEQGFIPNDGCIEEHEMAHFRLLADSKYLPYGRSVVEPARKEYKKLSLFEDAMLLQRIMRAPERRVFKVDIGNIAPEEVDLFMKDFISSVKKIPYIDQATGDYNLKFNLQNMLEDYYLPVRGEDSGTAIETLNGLASENHTQDVEYCKSKLLAALKIPPAWLGYESSADGKANLAGLDIRFSSTIERIQKVMTSELYKIAVIHLVAQGYSKDKLMDFELSLANSSTIRKRQEMDVLNEKMTLANNMLESKLFSRQFIYERIFDLASDESERESLQVLEDLKLGFRYKQIEDEGNDPKLTGKSFGTPHDIASMQMTSGITGTDVKKLYTDGGEDGRVNNTGQPTKAGTIATDRDQTFGRDPSGLKSLNNQAEGIGRSIFLKSHIDRIVDSKESSLKKTIIKESVADEYFNMLDETKLIDDEL